MFSRPAAMCVALMLITPAFGAIKPLRDPPPPPPPPPPVCSSTLVVCPAGLVPVHVNLTCPPGSPQAIACINPNGPPAYADLSCHGFAGGVHCEAYPQSFGNLHYSWSKTGPLHLTYTPSPDDAFIDLSCANGAHGTVSVTVSAPSGASVTLQSPVTCGP